MSLKHALLGFLNIFPMTGYELKKCFDSTVAHFWQAKLSQIYPTLALMAKEGLVTTEIRIRENAPNGKVCHITAAGRDELRRWMAEPGDPAGHREPFFIKVFFGSVMGKGDLLRLLEDRLERHRKRLAALTQIMTRFQTDASGLDPRLMKEIPFERFTVRAGILYEESRIAWCEETIRAARALKE